MDADPEKHLRKFLSLAKIFAVPAALVPVEKRAELLRSFGALVETVAVGEFAVDAILFVTLEGASSSLLTKLFAAIDVPFSLLRVVQCTISGMLAPLIVGEASVAFHGPTAVDPKKDDTLRRALAAHYAILEDFSRKTGMKIDFHHSGSIVREPFVDTPGKLHIFSNAGPPGDFALHFLYDVFGMYLTDSRTGPNCRQDSRGRGLVLMDGDVPVGQIVGTNIYLFIPTVKFFHEPASGAIFRQLLELAWGGLRKAAAAEEPNALSARKSQDAFVACGSGWITNWSTSCQKLANETDQQIRVLQKQLASLLRDKRSFEISAQAFVQSTDVAEAIDRLPKDFRRLQRNSNVARVAIKEEGIHIETKLLHAEHGGKTYVLGRYVIRIDRSGAVNVWCEQTLHPTGVPHPHIQKDGGTCYGNAIEAISKLASQHRYADTVELVLRWLIAGYTPALALVKIEEWPEQRAGNVVVAPVPASAWRDRIVAPDNTGMMVLAQELIPEIAEPTPGSADPEIDDPVDLNTKGEA